MKPGGDERNDFWRRRLSAILHPKIGGKRQICSSGRVDYRYDGSMFELKVDVRLKCDEVAMDVET